jgi:hypothetical protein
MNSMVLVEFFEKHGYDVLTIHTCSNIMGNIEITIEAVPGMRTPVVLPTPISKKAWKSPADDERTAEAPKPAKVPWEFLGPPPKG